MSLSSFSESAGSAFSKLGAGRPRHAVRLPLTGPSDRSLGKGEAPPLPLHSSPQARPQAAGLATTFRVLAHRAPMRIRSMPEPSNRKKVYSGSEKRQRQHRLTMRFSDEEWARLEELAGRCELSFTAYMRERGLGDRGPRAKRRAPIDVVELARASAALNKAGSNLNQIARALSAGGSAGLTPEQCETTLTEIRAAVAAIRQSVGHRKRG